jgi:hypothetical protein
VRAAFAPTAQTLILSETVRVPRLTR